MTPIIHARGLSRQFRRRGTAPVQAVDDVSLEILDGERVGLIGASGSGKTTLIKLLLGLDSPSEGSIDHRGSHLNDTNKRAFRRDVQVVFQDPRSSLDPQMQVSEIVREPLECLDVDGDHAERVNEVLRLVGLGEEIGTRRPHQLSGGQRQRVAIARAIAPRPRLLIADEPVSALDVLVRDEILDLLARLTSDTGLSLLLVSHDLSVIARLCDRILVMHDGRIVEEGSTATVYANPRHPHTRALISAVPRLDFQ
jgi:peptide/nickel transport system ATP-binding protein